MREKKDTSFTFDYEAVKNIALEQLKTGKPLLGKEVPLPHFTSHFWKRHWKQNFRHTLKGNWRKSQTVVMVMIASVFNIEIRKFNQEVHKIGFISSNISLMLQNIKLMLDDI